MSTSTWLASDSVEAICAQLDPMMMAAVGCCMSFSDHESVQWIAPMRRTSSTIRILLSTFFGFVFLRSATP